MGKRGPKETKSIKKPKIETTLEASNPIDEFDEEVEKSESKHRDREYDDDEDVSDNESVDLKPKKKKSNKPTKSSKKSKNDESDDEPKPKKSSKKSKVVDLSEGEIVSSEDEKPKKKKSSKSTKSPKKSKNDDSDDEPPKSAKKSKSSKPKSTKEEKESSMNKPTKAKKVNFKRDAPAEDPSSKVKTGEHKYPFVYKDTTYYCKYLPKNFQEQWDGICAMRKADPAPVDTMGAGKLSDKTQDPATQRFQTLISIVLSSQTMDVVTAKAMEKLCNFGLTVKNVLAKGRKEVIRHISGVNACGNKAKWVEEIATILHNEFNDDVPRTKAEMKTLPGCGDKVANLAMSLCWGEDVGIAVDTHMERILRRLQWTEHKDSKKQMVDLQGWMPKAMWGELNHVLVGFGQTICKTKPDCNSCSIKKTCDYYLTEF